MFSFDNTYGFISRGREELLPQYLPCTLQSELKHNWYDNENSGGLKKVYKRNKIKLRMIA